MAVIIGTTGNDNLVGTQHDDSISGRGGDDVLDAGPDGDDTLAGGGGDDSLISQDSGAGPRDIIMAGGAGDDSLFMSDTGFASTAHMSGGDGDDTIYGQGLISATIDAGAGADRLTLNGGQYLLTLGAGADLVSFGGLGRSQEATVTDFATAGAEADRLDFTGRLPGGWVEGQNPFATGDWRLQEVGGDTHLQQDVSGAWVDLAVLSGVTVSDLTAFSLNGFDPGGDIVGFTLGGGDGDDDLLGGFGDDSLGGGLGDDALRGGYGDDTLVGGGGRDSYYDRQGGDDLMIGSDGSDYFEIFRSSAAARSQVTVDGGAGADEINFDNGGANAKVLGGLGDGDDTVYASGGGVQVTLGAGDDTVTTSGGDGSYVGGPGVDSLSFAWCDQAVSVDLGVRGAQDTGVGVIRLSSFENLTGTDFADSLAGEKHANQLSGGGGDDTLIGGRGPDRLAGGSGDDLFVYQTAADSNLAKTDFILDLDAGDRIELTAIDADTGTAGDQAFHLVAEFSHQAGELVLAYDAARDRTSISGDVDGDGRADLFIWLVGDHRDFTGVEL